MGQAERGLIRGREGLKEGVAGAKRETEGIGAAGARRILEGRDAARAGISQNVTSRNLSGSSAEQFASRGLEDDTARRLSDNDARFAQLRANIHMGGAAAIAGSEGALAAHYQFRYQMESRDIWDRWFAIASGGGSSGAQPLDMSGLADFAGGLVSWLGDMGSESSAGTVSGNFPQGGAFGR